MRTSDLGGHFRILHLSDPHLTPSGIDMDGVDAAGSLRLVLEACDAVEAIDLVVVTGDIADDGSVGGCEAVLGAVSAFASARGVPHIYTTGNHDDRGSFAAVFGSGHLSADGSDRAELRIPTPEHATVSHLGGLRVVTLDSLVPGRTEGRLGPEQLSWLADVLRTPAPDGTVLALHHPPVHLPNHPMRAAVLENQDDLASVVRGSDVRVILAGHLHLQLSGILAGVPVWVTPGIVTRIDLTAPSHLVRGVLGGGASVVDLGGEFALICHCLQARDPRAGEQVYLYEAASGADVVDERPH